MVSSASIDHDSNSLLSFFACRDCASFSFSNYPFHAIFLPQPFLLPSLISQNHNIYYLDLPSCFRTVFSAAQWACFVVISGDGGNLPVDLTPSRNVKKTSQSHLRRSTNIQKVRITSLDVSRLDFKPHSDVYKGYLHLPGKRMLLERNSVPESSSTHLDACLAD